MEFLKSNSFVLHFRKRQDSRMVNSMVLEIDGFDSNHQPAIYHLYSLSLSQFPHL